MVNLTDLNLSSNAVQKIENLSQLASLRHLNLADNQITHIDPLMTLTNLESLNLAGNLIERLPRSFQRLQRLRVLRLARNKLSTVCLHVTVALCSLLYVQLRDIEHLRPLRNLVTLTLHGTPLSELPHMRSFVLYHLTTIEILDGQSITLQDREQASERFSRGMLMDTI